jgi:mannosyltransferase OCH1-like enzyme
MIKSKLENDDKPIPFVLYKTGKETTPGPEIMHIFDQILEDNKGLKIEYYNDYDSRNFIKLHFPNSVLNAYDKLIPGSYKADIFRYCILYVNGGIYGDLTQQYTLPLKEIVDLSKDICLVQDRISGKISHVDGVIPIQISFMAARPKLQIFMDAIEKCVKNIMNNNYGSNPLDITGPYLFGRVFKNYKNTLNYEMRLIQVSKMLVFNNYNDNGIGKNDNNTQKPIVLMYSEKHDKILGRMNPDNKGSSTRINHYHRCWYSRYAINENIPAILHKTEQDYLNATVTKLFDFIIYNNPCLIIDYYTPDMRRDFIKFYFNNDVLDAYDKLKPLFYKIQLFKYCVLYIKGGIYGNLEQQYLKPINTIIDLSMDLCLTAKSKEQNNIVDLSFIAAKPKLQLFLDIINTCVTNIKNKDYGSEPSDITGANVFNTIFEKHKNNLNYDFTLYKTRNYFNDMKTDQAVIDKKINGFTSLTQKLNRHNYIKYWKSKKVF